MTTIRLLVRRILVGAGLLTLGSGCSLFTAEPYELVCIGKKTGSVTSTGLHSHVTPVDENIERRFRIYPEESRVMYTTNTDSWEVCNGSCKASFSGSAVKIDLDYSIGEPFYGREITQIELELCNSARPIRTASTMDWPNLTVELRLAAHVHGNR